MTIKTISTVGLALALFLAVPSLAWAQSGDDKGDKAAADGKGSAGAAGNEEESPEVKVERGAGGKKVYRITTGFVIEGRIQKPNAFYVLERSQINYDWAALKKNFVPRILDAVKKAPF